jgi:hypothetical protein
MSEPPFRNDPSIANDEVLLRRLHPDWIVPGEHGRMRIASAAFKHLEMSVLFCALLENQGRSVQDALGSYSDNSLCSFTAGLARDLGQGIVYDVDPPNDPAHGLVVGKKTQSVANHFARGAIWVIPSEPPLVGPS